MFGFTPKENFQIATAMEMMMTAHAGQKYGEMDYFHHPIMVAGEIGSVHSPVVHAHEVIVALLHDTIEDTDVTYEDIKETFSPEIAGMVKILTKDENISYQENIQRIINIGNLSAMKVKLADNKVNLSGDKSQMSEARRTRLISQYEMSIKMLNDAIYMATCGQENKMKILFILGYLLMGMGYNEGVMTYHPFANDNFSTQFGRVVAYPVAIGFEFAKFQVENGTYFEMDME